MAQPNPPAGMADEDATQELTQLLAGLTDEQIDELADLAEAMHAEASDVGQ